MLGRVWQPERHDREKRVSGGLRRWITRILATIGLTVVIATVTPINLWWAHAYSGAIQPAKGDVLIVLSAAADDKGLVSFSSYWRTRYALLAWQTGNFKKIVISGGGGPGIMNFLVLEGVPREDIVAEWRSTSTRENAIETSRLIRGMPGKKVLLTSDFHMYRAIRVFRKTGIDVSPMPAPDVLKSSKNWNARWPDFERMTVETAKIVFYKLHGWM